VSPGWKSRLGLWRQPALLVHADREVTSLRRGVAAEVQRGRYTADIDGDFVVFLIGMRWWRPPAGDLRNVVEVAGFA